VVLIWNHCVIWIEFPAARFFSNHPGARVAGLLERQAPFSSIEIILKDERPCFFKSKISQPSWVYDL